MKIPKPAIVAGITTVVCAVILYVESPHLPYSVYRCLDAESFTDCVRGRPVLFRTVTLGSIYEGNTGDYIDRRVLFFGAYERPELYFLRDIANGGVFVDIGAHKGLYSLFLAKHHKEVHAFEPFPPILQQLQRNVAVNGAKNIVIHPVGLGETNSRLPFETPGATNMSMGSFAFLSDGHPHDSLEIVRGDDALRNTGVAKVDLIKMDIEGFERPALRGLAQTLADSRPIVMFELTLKRDNPTVFKSMDQLVQAFPANYKFLVFDERDPYSGAYKLVPASGIINFTTDSEQYNVVAYPAEKESRIALHGPVRAQ